jgi:hypothetical protein
MMKPPRSMRSLASEIVSQTLSSQSAMPHSQMNGSLPSVSGRISAWILRFRLRADAEAGRTTRAARRGLRFVVALAAIVAPPFAPGSRVPFPEESFGLRRTDL